MIIKNIQQLLRGVLVVGCLAMASVALASGSGGSAGGSGSGSGGSGSGAAGGAAGGSAGGSAGTGGSGAAGGSAGGSAGSGGAGGGSGGGGRVSYDLGKKTFQEKIVCSSCPYPNLEMTSEAVSPVVDELGWFGDVGRTLSYNERRSVKLFLKKRFSL